MSTELTPENLAEPPVPVDATPNQLLAYQADQMRKQTQGMKLMAYYAQMAAQDQRVVLTEISKLRQDFYEAEKKNNSTRTYIGCAFFIFVALPLFLIAMSFIFGTGLLASLSGS